jgi:hypothetical protein
VSDDAHLARFTRVLEERAIVVEPLVSVAQAVGIANVFLGVGTLSGGVQMLVPARAEALALVAPGVALPERSMLLVSGRAGETVKAGIVIGGPTTAGAAVDEVGPTAMRAAWLPVIESLVATDGRIKNRTRYVGEEHGSITISFVQRSAAGQAMLGAELTNVTTRLGVPAGWRRAFDDAGAGADVGVTTECTAAGLVPSVGLRFGPASFDRAIHMAKVIVDNDRARDAAVHMGMLAGGLGIQSTRGVEAVFDPTGADLVVWLKLGA